MEPTLRTNLFHIGLLLVCLGFSVTCAFDGHIWLSIVAAVATILLLPAKWVLPKKWRK